MKALASDITPLLITFNEEANIARVLERLAWAREIVVVDSGSTDATLAILARHANVRVVTRKFDSFARQCNFGLSQVRTPWVLSMDADYVLSEALVHEIGALPADPAIDGYRAGFVYRIHGGDVRGSLYPPRTVLYRVHGARYEDEGHGHRLRIAGRIGDLTHTIYHDDRKPLARWLNSQRNYAVKEADQLLGADEGKLSWIDKLRRTGWILPPLMLFYVLFAKGSILSGRAGFFYALQRSFAEALIALELWERSLSASSIGESSAGSLHEIARAADSPKS